VAKGVTFTDRAKADLRAIPQAIAIQIPRTIARFLESGEGNVNRLQGVEPPLYRLALKTTGSSATTATTSKSHASATARRRTVKCVWLCSFRARSKRLIALPSRIAFVVVYDLPVRP
jgi:hypothetical protein